MSLKDVFDKVKIHLLKQGKRCPLGIFNHNGLSCPIGFLSGGKVDSFISTLTEDEYYFVMELEGIHDSCNPLFWEYALNGLALKYGIDYDTVVETREYYSHGYVPTRVKLSKWDGKGLIWEPEY